jgi:hypothetical protein
MSEAKLDNAIQFINKYLGIELNETQKALLKSIHSKGRSKVYFIGSKR